MRPLRGRSLQIGVAMLVALAGTPSSAVAGPTSPGQVYAFGENQFGQLGSEANIGTAEPNATPASVTLPAAGGPVTQIAAGFGHSLVVTSAGQLYSFGDNLYGQLGSEANKGKESPNPTPAIVTLPGASGTVAQISAGFYHSLALTSTGQLFAFGNNLSGQLGNATHDETSEPNPTPTLVTLPGAGGQVTQMAAGGYHSLAVTSTGQLYAFGNNFDGQLGNEATSGTLTAHPTPTLVTLPGAKGPVTKVAAGLNHSLAMTSTGQLYAFGDNTYGQLGVAGGANPTPALVTLPGAGGPVTDIAAGWGHSLALTSTGQLYAFGYNFYGQLGIEAGIGSGSGISTPTLVTLPGASGPVTQIAAGFSQSLAVTSTGQVYAFGANLYGQLGIEAGSGTTNPNHTPALVGLPAGATIDTVARGPLANHALALVADLAVTSTSLPAGQVGVPYSASAEASGGSGSYRWAAAGLPGGLTINPADGQITGTPTSSGSAHATLTVTDAYGARASSGAIPLVVTAVPNAPVGSSGPAAPTRAQITSSLLSQLSPVGKGAKIAALLKHGYSMLFHTLAGGRVLIDWYYLPKGAHLSKAGLKPVLVAAGQGSFSGTGAFKLTIKLTTKGRQLLKHAKRLALIAKGTFTANGQQPITLTKRFVLKR